MRLRRSAAHRELKRLRRKLERLNQQKVAHLDLESSRRHILQEIAGDVAALRLTDQDAPAMDVIIDGHAAEWRQSVERDRHSWLAPLDHLEVEVRSHIAALAERAQEREDARTEIQGVAANLWDQVGDPELPKLDPLR